MTLNGPDEHVLELDSGGGCRAQEIYYKSLNRALEMGGFYNIKAMPQ
jgi:predicted nucleotide-binding protein (sugar kinase/HSP70/actin superfamily)